MRALRAPFKAGAGRPAPRGVDFVDFVDWVDFVDGVDWVDWVDGGPPCHSGPLLVIPAPLLVIPAKSLPLA